MLELKIKSILSKPKEKEKEKGNKEINFSKTTKMREVPGLNFIRQADNKACKTYSITPTCRMDRQTLVQSQERKTVLR